MNFNGAKGWLVGEPNKGLAAMFSMMNYERLTVGIQRVGCAEASYQAAVAYARERLQSRVPQGPAVNARDADPIIDHPDVRRMLLTMRALTEGGRALATYVGTELDIARHTADTEHRATAQARGALLTPLTKAFLTDTGQESCVHGQQVFGGHGYIREWGQEQRVREVRIAQIYEGTNGIQALDLLGRKVLGDKGEALNALLGDIRRYADASDVDYREVLLAAVQRLEQVIDWVCAQARRDPRQIGAASVEYLHLFGYVMFAYLWSRMASSTRIDDDRDAPFHSAKRATAHFFFERLLLCIDGLSACLYDGASSLYSIASEDF